MKESKSNWSKALPYLIGSLLFLIGGARLYVRGDVIGAVIFTITGVIALITAFIQTTQPGANSS